MAQNDYLPVATGAGANVDTQAQFAGSGYQQNGFVVGTAQPSQANKIWRQASMVGSAVAQTISDLLNIDVLDDGNFANLVANFKRAIASGFGFTPVQQGTGVGQLDNAVKIGWDGAHVRVTIDVTDEGAITLASDLAPVSTAAAAAQATANTGVANAATAQAAAVAAQGTANTALADATTALGDIAALIAISGASINANGFFELSNGIIVQWGTTGITSGVGTDRGSAPIAFAISFPNAAWSCVAVANALPSSGTNDPMSTIVSGLNTAGATANFCCAVPTGGGGSTIAAGTRAMWIAVGN
jgi:hypothetical protein